MTRTRIDWPAILATARQLCLKAAAPDLAGLPVYVLAGSALPPTQASAGDFCAYTTPDMDLFLRPHLEGLGQWRGRGPCMVIGDVYLGRENPDPEAARDMALAAALHELAHALDGFMAGLRALAAPDPAWVIYAGLACAAALDRREDEEPDPLRLVKHHLRSHGVRFLRACVHLCHRARAWAGIDLPIRFVVGDYPAPRGWAYALAVGDEPGALAGLPITAILDTPAPAALTAEWALDYKAGWDALSDMESTHAERE